MTISITSLKQAIKRHLSVIGKRLYGKEGNNLFSNITVSTAEDPIFEQYITAGAQNIESMLRQLVTAYSVSSTTVNITLTNTRGKADFDTRCGEMINSYITLYTVGEYLDMTHPELAEKYKADANNSIMSLVYYAFQKEAPASSASSYANVTGTIS